MKNPIAWLLLMMLLADTARSEDLPVSVRVLGTQAGNPASRTYGGVSMARRSADLGFKHGGEIAEVGKDWGDPIQAGEQLASLKSASFDANLANARAELELAKAGLAASQAQLDISAKTERRLIDLKAQGHISAQLLDEATAAQRTRTAQHAVAAAGLQRARALVEGARVALAESQIIAPFAGVIQTRYLDPGAQVKPGEPVLRLIETSSMEARVGVPENVAPSLSRDGTYTLLWQDQALACDLIALLPEIDPATRTQTAVFALPDTKVPVGAVVLLKLPYVLDVAGYWVPLAALGEAERGLWSVYVANRDGIAERRLVEVMHTDTSEALVRGTLRDGDQLITSAANRLVPGQKVVVIRSGDGG
jgi:membrane fusion protein, multidrug efflux system